ncbi:hypothetical protein ASPSYDRAFT_500635 [Aspergillus sydowii CBS 593.65]|uniref:Uncharacterized protein n=1 Tax=Aspergillus sydowii CBS 593.65 TaxID=1036612 RepID=A0A1L9T2Q6_9EURO|nr:uncharacterized protein ASPSYDRAFT_500635 [Aspergillus sydowii CBS 593.65]OJJ53699.1 hypothetical protein ASPSYDRAFT_500635 [Aspergillus sydowii CBS 593.65]
MPSVRVEGWGEKETQTGGPSRTLFLSHRLSPSPSRASANNIPAENPAAANRRSTGQELRIFVSSCWLTPLGAVFWTCCGHSLPPPRLARSTVKPSPLISPLPLVRGFLVPPLSAHDDLLHDVLRERQVLPCSPNSTSQHERPETIGKPAKSQIIGN